MATSDDFDRKSIKGPDQFQYAALAVVHYAQRWRWPLTILGVVISIGLLSWQGWGFYQKKLNSAAAEAFFAIQQLSVDQSQNQSETSGEIEKALKIFVAEQRNPWLVTAAWLELGRLAVERKAPEQAQVAFSEAAQLAPKASPLYVTALLELAQLAEDAGDLETATQHYQLLPSQTHRALKGYMLARLALLNNQTEQAHQYLQQASDQNAPLLRSLAAQALHFIGKDISQPSPADGSGTE